MISRLWNLEVKPIAGNILGVCCNLQGRKAPYPATRGREGKQGNARKTARQKNIRKTESLGKKKKSPFLCCLVNMLSSPSWAWAPGGQRAVEIHTGFIQNSYCYQHANRQRVRVCARSDGSHWRNGELQSAWVFYLLMWTYQLFKNDYYLTLALQILSNFSLFCTCLSSKWVPIAGVSTGFPLYPFPLHFMWRPLLWKHKATEKLAP